MRPSSCVPAPWAPADVPLCTIGDDLEVLMPGPPREPQLFKTDRKFWDWFGKKLALQYRNHSCKYIGNTHDRRAPSTEDVHKQGLSKQGLQGVYDGPVRASVLDFGADISGQQYQVFSRYFDGPMIGWNVRTPHGNFKPTEKLQAQDMGNFSLVFGERDSCLPFQDNTFDYVWSHNVLEHVNPAKRYLEEIHRVLKPGGLFWAKYNPHWFSPRGHHLQKNVVEGWMAMFAKQGHPECADLPFEADGTTVPDWGHLYLSAEEMQAALNKTALCPPLIDRMIAFVYHESLVFALNKFHYRQVVDILANDLGMDMLQLDLGSEVVQHGPSIAALERIGALYGHGDILFSGVEMMFAKPLSKGGGERMGGHHAVGSSVFQKSSVDGLVNKTDACACVVASSASTACGVAHVTCHGSTRGAPSEKCVKGKHKGMQICKLGDLHIVQPAAVPRTKHLGQDIIEQVQHMAQLYLNHSCRAHEHACHHAHVPSSKRPPVPAQVLEMGTDPSAARLSMLSSVFEGPVVGWTMRHPDHPPIHTVVKPSMLGNFSIVESTTRDCLPFRDASFDIVWISRDLEHIPFVQQYIQEAVRVLKPRGLLFVSLHDHWFSARGHHLHKDMIQQWSAQFVRQGDDECANLPFENDGSTVPDWAHLYMTERELRFQLYKTPLGLCVRMVQQIAGWLYNDTQHLNKVHHTTIQTFIEQHLHMERVLYSLKSDPATHPSRALGYHQARRLARKQGHGDVMHSTIDMVYAKPMV